MWTWYEIYLCIVFFIFFDTNLTKCVFQILEKNRAKILENLITKHDQVSHNSMNKRLQTLASSNIGMKTLGAFYHNPAEN